MDTTYECFDVSVADHVAVITMSRPEKRNSMIASFWRDLPVIVDELSDSGEVRCIVLNAEGKHFNAGMDLSVFGGDNDVSSTAGRSGFRSRNAERFRTTVLKLQDTFTALERARVPVLAAIQGACVGGGIDMVSACDMRYATADAFFCIAEVNIGMTADVGTLQRLPKLVPEGIVKELAFTGRRWTAEEAKAAGFVNAVYETNEELQAAVLAVAREIASKTPMTIWGTKRTIHYTREHSVEDSLDYIGVWNAAMFDTDDMGEAFAAQMENRDAEFPDLPPASKGL
ncbi:MAG: crotonase/enoyl-CoA hydratase family protein [Acidimicrobiales bacterium]